MNFEVRYQKQLNRLRQEANAFAQRVRGLGPYLSPQAQHPEIERLLAGMAFLLAKSDEDADRLSEAMSVEFRSILAPEMNRPRPAEAIIELGSDDLSDQEWGRETPAGLMLKVPEGGVSYGMRTRWPVWRYPLKLTQTRVIHRGDVVEWVLRFSLLSKSCPKQCVLPRLRLYLGGSPLAAIDWAWAVSTQCVNISRRCVDGSDMQTMSTAKVHWVVPEGHLDQRWISLAHFMPQFSFIDLCDLTWEMPPQADQFECVLTCQRGQSAWETVPPVSLNCTPAENIMTVEGVPIRRLSGRSEYPLQVERAHVDQLSLLQVKHMEGWHPKSNRRIHYHAMGHPRGSEYQWSESMDHRRYLLRTTWDAGRTTPVHTGVFCGEERDPSGVSEASIPGGLQGISDVSGMSRRVDGEIDQLYSLRSDPDSTHGEVVSWTAEAYQYEIARVFQAKAFQSSDPHPNVVSFRALTPITDVCFPTESPGAQGALLRFLTCEIQYWTLDDVREYWMTGCGYRLPSARLTRWAHALVKLEHQSVRRLYRGTWMLGIRTSLWWDERSEASPGVKYLLGRILFEMAQDRTPLTGFHDIWMHGIPSGELHRWEVDFDNNSH